jgi:hypothetical protein
MPVELSRAPKYLPYNYGSHFISVPELRKAIRKWKNDLNLKHLNGKSKEFLLDFALEHDILKNHFTEKNMAFPPPADSHMKKKPAEQAREDANRAAAAARDAARAERKANPKKRGRKPKAKEPEKKEEPAPVATPAAAPGPKRVGRKLKVTMVEPPKEEKNGLTSAVDADNRRIPLAKFLAANKGKGLSQKMLKFQYLEQLEKLKALPSLSKKERAAAAPAADKKKRGPNAFAMFVKANKKPGMSMKDVAELYKKNKAAPKEEPKKEGPKEEVVKSKRRVMRAPPQDTSVEEREMLPEALNLPKVQKDTEGGASVVNLTPVLNAIMAKPSANVKAPRGKSKTRPPVPSTVKSVRQLRKVEEVSSSDDEKQEMMVSLEELEAKIKEMGKYSSAAEMAQKMGKTVVDLRKLLYKTLNKTKEEEERENEERKRKNREEALKDPKFLKQFEAQQKGLDDKLAKLIGR